MDDFQYSFPQKFNNFVRDFKKHPTKNMSKKQINFNVIMLQHCSVYLSSGKAKSTVYKISIHIFRNIFGGKSNFGGDAEMLNIHILHFYLLSDFLFQVLSNLKTEIMFCSINLQRKNNKWVNTLSSMFVVFTVFFFFLSSYAIFYYYFQINTRNKER